jgi:site-specific recombinase XerD
MVIADPVLGARSILGSSFDSSSTEIKELAGQLAQAAHMSKRPSTMNAYAPAWKKFVAWLNDQGVDDPLSVPGTVVACYLHKLGLESQVDTIGSSRVSKASAAIAAYFEMYGRESPTNAPACKLAREIAERVLKAKPLNRDELRADELMTLLDTFGDESTPLHFHMHVTAYLLMFMGALRFDEISRISVDSRWMVFGEDYVEIYIPRSKTDPKSIGRWIVIPAIPGPYCPLLRLRALLQRGKYLLSPSSPNHDVGPLLRAVTSDGQHLRQYEGLRSDPIMSISYTRFLEVVKELVKRVGLDKNVLPHSFRIGATSEAADMHTPQVLLKKLGNWKSDAMPQLYSRVRIDALVNVSRALGMAIKK